jgi:hypothetical protein
MTVFKSITLCLALVGLALLSSCDIEEICTQGEGSAEAQTLSLPNFTGIDLRIDGQVYLRPGSTQSVEVIGQANIIDKLKLDVDQQVWKIDLEGCNRNYEDLVVYITLPELDYVKISGSGAVIADSVFTVDDVELILSGAGELNMNLAADFVYTKVSGSGDIDLTLSATRLESEISGSGNFYFQGDVPNHLCEIRGSGKLHGFSLFTDRTEIKISGSGDAEIFARNQLDIHITGSGDVKYQGNPALTIDVDGSGEVVDAN